MITTVGTSHDSPVLDCALHRSIRGCTANSLFEYADEWVPLKVVRSLLHRSCSSHQWLNEDHKIGDKYLHMQNHVLWKVAAFFLYTVEQYLCMNIKKNRQHLTPEYMWTPVIVLIIIQQVASSSL